MLLIRRPGLLHTWEKPVVQGNVTISGHKDGRLFTKTILPEDFVITTIGGEGKEFWVGNQNYSLPEDPVQPELNDTGKWRIEVSPKANRLVDYFLHVIYPTDKKKEKMADVELVKETDKVGVKFSDGVNNFEVLFNTSGGLGGKITITKSGRTLIQKPLTEKVELTNIFK